MSTRLQSIELLPDVRAEIIADASASVEELLGGRMANVEPRNDTLEGRAKFELLYLRQELIKSDINPPLYVHGEYRPTALRNLFMEGIYDGNGPDGRAVETIINALDFGCRKITPKRVPQLLRVIDWFVAKFVSFGEVPKGTPERSFIEDLAAIRSQISSGGALPPYKTGRFPNFDEGMERRFRAYRRNGGGPLVGEGYRRLAKCIEGRFIPLMPYDIVGNRNIFIYMSLGQFDPLDPDPDLRELEYT